TVRPASSATASPYTTLFRSTAVMAALAATVSRVPMVRRQRVFLVVFAVVCLLAIGEELSWGQRIFGFEPPTTAEDSILKVGHRRSEEHTSELQSRENLVCRL